MMRNGVTDKPFIVKDRLMLMTYLPPISNKGERGLARCSCHDPASHSVSRLPETKPGVATVVISTN